MSALRLLLPLILSGLFVLPLSAFAAGRCERLIVTGSPDTPPYLWRDPQDPGHLIGANADLFKQAVHAIGLKVEVLYAGKRSQAMDEVHAGRMDMLIDAPLSLSELDSVDYVYPALIPGELMTRIPSLDAAGQSAAPDKSGLFLALSFNSVCNDPWLRGQLAKKMTEFATSGLASDALQRNLERWKAHSSLPASVPNQ
ncbi:hypothetical protein [Pseudomonas sp. NA-150]|uniref:hypothetical protein n=1 Tax=Pseudomonas sp. NA-150 TaxID=3367525 RepID=UPI0037C91124